jgi:hypothetical protein
MLNLRQIHKLYLLLKDCLPEQEEGYLIDEIESMIGRMKSDNTLFRAIEIMYPKKEIDARNSMEVLLLFIRGLKENEFFEYVHLINGIKRGKRTG